MPLAHGGNHLIARPLVAASSYRFRPIIAIVTIKPSPIVKF